MVRIIDLSLTLENYSYVYNSPEILYSDHEEGIKRIGKAFGINNSDWPDNLALSTEKFTSFTHVGTHLDAPYHVTPFINGKRAMTIDEVPLEWCFGDGVILDMTCKKDGEYINKEDIVKALIEIDYKIKERDIVLIRTDAYKTFNSLKYLESGPGMSREATEYLVNLGVRVMGIDTFTFERPIPTMIKDYKKGTPGSLWPSHLLGRELLHFHMEQMANLDQIPEPFGFKVAAFPIKIKKASGAWVRPVAIIND